MIFDKLYLVKIGPNFNGSQLSCVTFYYKILSVCSLVCKNLLNSTWQPANFHNRHHTSAYLTNHAWGHGAGRLFRSSMDTCLRKSMNMLWQHLYPVWIWFLKYATWNLFRRLVISLAFTKSWINEFKAHGHNVTNVGEVEQE